MPYKKILFVVSILTLCVCITESCEEGQLFYSARKMLGLAKAKNSAPAQQNSEPEKIANPQGQSNGVTATKPGRRPGPGFVEVVNPRPAKGPKGPKSSESPNSNSAEITELPLTETLAPKISLAAKKFEANCPDVTAENYLTIEVYEFIFGLRHTLMCSVYSVLKVLKFISPDQGKTDGYFKGLKLEDAIAGLEDLQSKYDNKADFHGSRHATDVVFTLIHFVNALSSLKVIKFTNIEILGLVFAAAGINAGHPGFSNAHVKSKATTDFKAWAMKPDGSGPLESPNQAHATTLTLETLAETNSKSLIKSLGQTERNTVRQIIEENVIATDYPPESGSELLDKFTALVAKVTRADEFMVTKDADRVIVFKVLLIIADNGYKFKDDIIYTTISHTIVMEYRKETNGGDDPHMEANFLRKTFNDFGPLLKDWEKLLIKAAGNDKETKGFIQRFLKNYDFLETGKKPKGFTK